MRYSLPYLVLGLAVTVVGAVLGVALVRYSAVDDAPGGVLLGLLLIAGAAVLGWWVARRGG